MAISTNRSWGVKARKWKVCHMVLAIAGLGVIAAAAIIVVPPYQQITLVKRFKLAAGDSIYVGTGEQAVWPAYHLLRGWEQVCDAILRKAQTTGFGHHPLGNKIAMWALGCRYWTEYWEGTGLIKGPMISLDIQSDKPVDWALLASALRDAPSLRLIGISLQSDGVVPDDFMKVVGKLPNLEELALKPAIPGITDENIGCLTKSPGLRRLYIKHGSLTPAGLKELSKCPSLTYLDLSGEMPYITEKALLDLRAAAPRLSVDCWLEQCRNITTQSTP